MELKNESILVVGAGITGLSIGYWLKKQGKKVTVVESADKVGGKIDTIYKDGFELDIGPVTCALTPALSELLQELELTDQIATPSTSSSKRYIYSKGKIHRIEASVPKLLLNPILSIKGRLSLFGDLWCKNRNEPTEDESVASFVRRHFGEEAHQKLFNPVLGGIYAGDTEQLSIQSCLPMLKDLALQNGSVIKGLKKNQKNLNLNRKIINLKGGFGKIIEALQSRLSIDLQLSTELISVVRDGDQYIAISKTNNQEFSNRYDRIYFTQPAYSLSKAIEGIDIRLSHMLLDISYNKVWQVYLSIDADDIRFDGFGLLVPAQETKLLLGVIYVSGLFPDKAPAGKKLFALFCGGTRSFHPDMDIKNAVEEFCQIFKLTKAPIVLHAHGWDKAIPQFNVGHTAKKQMIKSFEAANPQLHVAGNYVSGVAVGDCVKYAFDLTCS